jgi:poly(beta-D-mannuronate) lyase
MRAILLVAGLLASILVGCSPGLSLTGGTGADSWVVRQPGRVMVDSGRRRAVLARIDETGLAELCGPRRSSWPSYKAVTRVRPPGESGEDVPSAAPFTLTVMQQAARALGAGDAIARRGLVELLDRWAKGGGLRKLDPTSTGEVYSLNRALLPLIASFAIVREAPEMDRARRDRIEAWLGVLVRSRPPPGGGDPDRVTSANNHLYLHASVDMAWGALRGDDTMFRKGIAAYRRALGDMREDGSLPLETMRGARALWYQRHALASLVTIAEIAAQQGYDLYALEVDGVSIHRGIGFLLDAIAEPARVWPYAQTDFNPGTTAPWREQDLTFLERRGANRHYMAWAEAYLARFPERDESRRLVLLLRATGGDRFRPLLDDYSGGNTSCFYARPETPTAP